MTSKLQLAIDAESENRSDLARELKRVPPEDLKAKQRIEAAVQKSEDKMQSMAVLMLHYCSGSSLFLAALLIRESMLGSLSFKVLSF